MPFLLEPEALFDKTTQTHVQGLTGQLLSLLIAESAKAVENCIW